MSAFIRIPTHRYEDPLARIWVACAEGVGFRVVRTAEAYASTDGKSTLLIGEDSLLDPDDSLAQMIFHELCHALVEGETGERQPDWGLDNTSGRHTWREHACLRLQAYLADSVGLREFFAPTTDFRVKFWASLPADPFAAAENTGGRRECSCVAARLAAWRASQRRWKSHLESALSASADIAALMPTNTRDDEAAGALPSLWTCRNDRPPRHPAGHSYRVEYQAGASCGTCVWGYPFRGELRCRHAPAIRLAQETPACARWEPVETLDCQDCGACCREAYHSVELGPRDRVIRRHPALVIHCETHRKLRREGNRCAALLGGETPMDTYRCDIYPDRPGSCRDFARGGAHCLDARRRVGLSL